VILTIRRATRALTLSTEFTYSVIQGWIASACGNCGLLEHAYPVLFQARICQINGEADFNVALGQGSVLVVQRPVVISTWKVWFTIFFDGNLDASICWHTVAFTYMVIGGRIYLLQCIY
jgi:hypothetical protein